MANDIRIIFAGCSLFLIGAFLYYSPGLVEIGFLGFQPMLAPHVGSPLLLTTIGAFTILETLLIAFVFAKRTDKPTGSTRQFGISNLLVGILILTIPLAILPIYESVVSVVPVHPHGDRGLPNWLFVALTYFMLLPIIYICQTVKRILQNEHSQPAG